MAVPARHGIALKFNDQTAPDVKFVALQVFDGGGGRRLEIPMNACAERARLFSIHGQVVHEVEFSEEQGWKQVDVSGVPNGTYVLLVEFTDHMRAAHVVVQR